jgi:hypothetical protein
LPKTGGIDSGRVILSVRVRHETGSMCRVSPKETGWRFIE